MEKNSIWLENFKIYYHTCNLKKQATLPAIGSLIQEVASNHAQDLGIGYYEMLEHNVIWVLSRMKIQIERYPVWNDSVQVFTWVKSREPWFSERDITIQIANELIANATTTWLLIDTQTRRPVDLTGFAANLPIVHDKVAINERLTKLPNLTNPTELATFHVKFENLDLHNHVNNVQYLSWIINHTGNDWLFKFDVTSIEINYLAEVLIDQKISLFIEQTNDSPLTTLYSFIRTEDSKEVCKACVIWS